MVVIPILISQYSHMYSGCCFCAKEMLIVVAAVVVVAFTVENIVVVLDRFVAANDHE